MRYRFVYEQPLKPGIPSKVIYFQTQVIYFNASSDIKAHEKVINELKGKQFWHEKRFYPCKLISLEALRPIPISHLKIDDMELT